MVTAAAVENGMGPGAVDAVAAAGGVDDDADVAVDVGPGDEAQPAKTSVTSTALRKETTHASSSSGRVASRGRGPQYRRLRTAPG